MTKPENSSPESNAPGSASDYFGEYKPGQYIFKEGEPGALMFIIQNGEVEILKWQAKEERRVALLEQGDFFGEMAILEGLPRGASARAVTPCTLLKIDSSTFDQILRENPEVAVRMMRKLSRRLREASGRSPERQPAAPAAAAARPEMPAPPQPAPEAPAAAPAPPEPAAPPPSAAEAAAAKPQAEPAAAPQAPPAAQPAPAESRPPRLRGDAEGIEFMLPLSGDVTIGRFDSVTGIAPDVDLTAVDRQRTTSRRHAKILREDARFFLFEEVGTANGTFINGERIPTGIRKEFQSGDTLRFGTVTLKFESS